MLVAENPHDIQRLVQIPRWRRASSDEQPSKDKGKQVQSDATSSASPSVHDDLDTAKQDHTTTADNTQDESENDEYEYVDRDVWLYEHLR